MKLVAFGIRIAPLIVIPAKAGIQSRKCNLLVAPISIYKAFFFTCLERADTLRFPCLHTFMQLPQL